MPNGRDNVIFSVFKRENTFLVLQIPKCGSTTLRSCQLTSIDLLQYKENRDKFSKIMVFMGEPINRFHICFKFYTDHGRSVPPKCKGNYKEFVDWGLVDGQSDQHLMPQSNFINLCENPEIYKLCDMNRILGGILGYKLPDLNPSNRKALITDYRQADIIETYKEDIELYNGLC